MTPTPVPAPEPALDQVALEAARAAFIIAPPGCSMSYAIRAYLKAAPSPAVMADVGALVADIEARVGKWGEELTPCGRMLKKAAAALTTLAARVEAAEREAEVAKAKLLLRDKNAARLVNEHAARTAAEAALAGAVETEREACAQFVETHQIVDTSSGQILAPRSEGNRAGIAYAAGIRIRAPAAAAGNSGADDE